MYRGSMQKLLAMAPNVAALVSIIAALAAAGSAVIGWSYGAGAHAERDRQVDLKIAALERQVRNLPAQEESSTRAQCISLSNRAEEALLNSDRERIRELMSDLGCHRSL